MRNNNTYTLNRKTYDLLIQDGDIILESLDHDLIFVNGFESCKDDARGFLNKRTDYYGRPIRYNEPHVYEVALHYIEDFIKTEGYKILKHKNN